MADKLSEVYEQYEMVVGNTFKGRGANIIDCDFGIRQLKPLTVGDGRIASEYIFKEKMYELGFSNIDRVIKNKEDDFFGIDKYGTVYVLRDYFLGREIQVNSPEDIDIAVDNLADFHKIGRIIYEQDKDAHIIRSDNNFEKRNKELKRVRNFVAKRHPKQKFENIYIDIYDRFYLRALDCQKKQKNNELHLGYCHGSYDNHSVLICQDENGDTYVATVGFDRFYVGNQLEDLYHFARKIIEKNNYDIHILERILERYSESIEITVEDLWCIYNYFAYPEKFYKLSSQYMNSSKNWISPKMLEKIGRIVDDEENVNILLQKMREKYL